MTALRTFSISAGLDASTVTPGSTAPEASRTTPAIDLCRCQRRHDRDERSSKRQPDRGGRDLYSRILILLAFTKHAPTAVRPSLRCGPFR